MSDEYKVSFLVGKIYLKVLIWDQNDTHSIEIDSNTTVGQVIAMAKEFYPLIVDLVSKNDVVIDTNCKVLELDVECYLRCCKLPKKAFKYSNTVIRVWSNFSFFYVNKDSMKIDNSKIQRTLCTGIRRTLCIASRNGICNAFIFKHWERIQNVLINEQTEMFKIHLGYKVLKFNPKEVINAYLKPNQPYEMIQRLRSLPGVKFNNLCSSNQCYGDLFSIIFPFVYTSLGSPEQQYVSKVVTPLFDALFWEKNLYLSVPEYRGKWMNYTKSNEINIDLCYCPHGKSSWLPPLFVVEIAGGKALHLDQDHKDFQRLYDASRLIIANYITIIANDIDTEKAMDGSIILNEEFIRRVNKLIVFGCMTCNLCFQFFISYPVIEDDKLHINFQVPDSWRVDLSTEDDVVEDTFLQFNEQNDSTLSTEWFDCFTEGAKDAELPILKSMSDYDTEDELKEPDAKKSKMDHNDVAELKGRDLELFLTKFRFIKGFLYCAKQHISEMNMSSYEPANNILEWLGNIPICKSRKGMGSNTTSAHKNATKSLLATQDDYQTPSRTTKSGLVKWNDKLYYCVVKDVGKYELQILKYLKIRSSLFICQYYTYLTTNVNNETQLLFESLTKFKDLKYKRHRDLLNTCLNYSISGIQALQFLKSCNIYHRDISPSNILVKDPGTPNECWKLIDFGHSVFADQHRDTDVFGTEGYIDATKPFTFNNDLYSFGLCVKSELFDTMIYHEPDTERSVQVLDFVLDWFKLMKEYKDLDELMKYGISVYSKFKELYGFANCGTIWIP